MKRGDIAKLDAENEKLREMVGKLGAALVHQDEFWGLIGNESQEALREFKKWKGK